MDRRIWLNSYMNLKEVFVSYIHYLIHPFKTHQSFLAPDNTDTGDYRPLKLSAYESLATSWLFVVINGIIKIVILNFSIHFMLDLFHESFEIGGNLIDIGEFPGLYFLVLSSFLDIIFYPLFGIFIIQFWEVIIKFYSGILGVEGDLSEKSHRIMSVYFSSSILTIIPFVGSSIQSLASMVLMYAGLREQLKTSPVLSVCIILTPILIFLGLLSLVVLAFVISL
jgi:hypothetical protein